MALLEIKSRTLLKLLVCMLLASTVAAAQSDTTGAASPTATKFTQNVPSTARAIFERAMKMRKAGKTQVAMSLIEESLRVFPGYFDARYALANDLARMGYLNEAITQLELARKINANDDRLYQSFGAILIEQKKYALAAAAFAEAARLNPANPRYFLMRGVAILYYVSEIDAAKKESSEDRQFLLSKAEEALNRASLLSERKIKIVHFYLGMLYEKKGEPRRAADELELYLRDSPQTNDANTIRETIERLRNSQKVERSSQPPS
jgi:tetratricopeptide (TPR) repeat protein